MQQELTKRCRALTAFQERITERKKQMEALREATIKEIHELVETENEREIGPLFENDGDLDATC